MKDGKTPTRGGRSASLLTFTLRPHHDTPRFHGGHYRAAGARRSRADAGAPPHGQRGGRGVAAARTVVLAPRAHAGGADGGAGDGTIELQFVRADTYADAELPNNTTFEFTIAVAEGL